MLIQQGNRPRELSTQSANKNPAVAHFWGVAAPSIAQLGTLHSHASSRSGEPLVNSAQSDTVVVPSHWGNFNTAVLAETFVADGHDPQVVRLCDAVAVLGPSAARYSFLVEIHRDSSALTLLPWNGNRQQTKLTHTVCTADGDDLVETIIALSYSMIVYPDRTLDKDICIEAVGDSGVTAYSALWRSQVEFIIAHYPPGTPRPRGYSVVDLLHNRRFQAYEVPAAEFAQVANEDFCLSGEFDSDNGSSRDSLVCRDSVLKLEELVATDMSSGFSSGSEESFLQRHLRVAAAISTVVLLVCCLGIFALADNRPTVQASEHVKDNAHFPQTPTAPTTAEIPSPLESSPSDLAASTTTSAAPAPRLVAAGIQAEFPQGWSLDPHAPPDKLIAVNGGQMRVVAQVHEVAAGTSLDDVIVRLSAASATRGVSEINRSAIDGMEMVTHVERPASGQSVVLWHHRIEGQTQVSVGCQYRGSTIPVIRTDCDLVVRTAHPM